MRIVWAGAGSRTLKYHQTLDEVLELADDERALLTVLLLRGPQAPGELRTRTERLHAFADRGAVEQELHAMAGRPQPLVVELERRAGQQDARWAHLLGPLPAGATGGGAAVAAVDRESVLRRGRPGPRRAGAPPFEAVAAPYAEASATRCAGCPSSGGCSSGWRSRRRGRWSRSGAVRGRSPRGSAERGRRRRGSTCPRRWWQARRLHPS